MFIIFLAEPILEDNIHVNDIEYSPLVCGFGITLNDGRAAYLTAPNLKFDPNVSFGTYNPLTSKELLRQRDDLNCQSSRNTRARSELH